MGNTYFNDVDRNPEAIIAKLRAELAEKDAENAALREALQPLADAFPDRDDNDTMILAVSVATAQRAHELLKERTDAE